MVDVLDFTTVSGDRSRFKSVLHVRLWSCILTRAWMVP